jgi:DNA-binding GntR family transcriptional regulator
MRAVRSRKAITSGNDRDVPRGPERPYEIVATDLRRRIAAGEWQPGEALPTVAVLAEHYGVSKATVTRVLRILADEGLVRVVPRWGTFRASEG